ncbi:hypothetical protein KFK09_024551 [Dendrobium nobile]|uniref:Uncharacterized protein n=1 Tax=Dendrobium nobile TaxID=94219 RepID=A0A8T3ADD8_DENNO|nr:hypothetical protein KFK09_024551 [Dendrobium nobile]
MMAVLIENLNRRGQISNLKCQISNQQQCHPDDGRVDWKSQPEGSNLKSQIQ